jgi:hypothetical protein
MACCSPECGRARRRFGPPGRLRRRFESAGLDADLLTRRVTTVTEATVSTPRVVSQVRKRRRAPDGFINVGVQAAPRLSKRRNGRHYINGDFRTSSHPSRYSPERKNGKSMSAMLHFHRLLLRNRLAGLARGCPPPPLREALALNRWTVGRWKLPRFLFLGRLRRVRKASRAESAGRIERASSCRFAR